MGFPQLRRRLAPVVLILGLSACSGDRPASASLPGLAGPVEALAFDAQTVSLPADIDFVYPRTPTFIARDGSDLVFTYNTASSEKRELGYIRIDGSGFRCLTCGTETVGESPYSFGDGQRVLIQQGADQSTGQLSQAVLRCEPSLADCQTMSIKPVAGMATGNRIESLQDRVVLVAPAGDALLWSRIRMDRYLMLLGRLRESADRYEVTDIRVVNPHPDPTLGDAAGPLAEAAWYEAKGLGSDGRTLTFTASLGESLNFDWFALDLVSGALRRQTTDPDWDEGSVASPDLSLFKGATGRGRNEIAVFGNMPRPGLLDFSIVGPLANYYLPRHLPSPLPVRDRRILHGVLVLDAQGEGAGNAGLDLTAADAAEGWINSGQADIAAWSLDGRRIAVGQRRPDEASATRLRIFTLASRAPVQVQPASTWSPHWAPRIEDVPVRIHADVRQLQGPAGGTALLQKTGSLVEGAFSVTYLDYSVDGCSYLNGTQSMVVNAAITGTFRESLRIHGCKTGESDIDVRFADLLTTGRADSRYQGRDYALRFGP